MIFLPKFIFAHIPKTAGTSFRIMIENLYGGKAIPDRTWKKNRQKGIYLGEEIIKKYPKIRKNNLVIYGHFKASKYKHLGRPMFTFIRHPVERTISHYSSWLKKNSDEVDMSFYEFVKMTSNYMTRMIDGNLKLFSIVGITEYFDKSILRFENKLGIKFSKISKKNVNRNKIELDEKEKRIILENNIKDMNLYEKILRKYE